MRLPRIKAQWGPVNEEEELAERDLPILRHLKADPVHRLDSFCTQPRKRISVEGCRV